MAPDQDPRERDRAVRAMLVEQVTQPTPTPLFPPERFRTGLVTAVVLVAIVALSIVAVRFGAGRVAPADGGEPSVTAGLPTPTSLPAGELLGRFTSDDGPVQTHTIHPNGLAIASAFECEGVGDWSVSVAHAFDSAAITPPGQKPGSCRGESGSAGNKGLAGSTTVKITSSKGVRWTLTIVGIPETYVTPRPIPTPTASTGTAVRYCTADDLQARFDRKKMPDGVTEVEGGDLAFTNRSATTCALAGYPEVRFVEGSTPLGHHSMDGIDERMSTEHGLKAVVLKPGGAAYSQIDWYLANYYPENDEPRCDSVPVHAVQVDLAYDLASPGQTGTLEVPIGTAHACTLGAHGALGKYGQIGTTVFLDYTR